MTRVLRGLVLVATLAACTATTPPSTGHTSRPSPTRPCTLESRPPTGTITRFAAAPGTTWWVTYTVIANPCGRPAKLSGVDHAGQQPGSGAVWSGDARVVRLDDGQVPDAILPGGRSAKPSVAGYTIRPSERVEVVALVTAGGGKDVSHRVPAMRLRLLDDGGAADLTLAPDLRLCACNPLS